MAAGKGVRMRSTTPKVLHTVCGKPLMAYVLDVVKAVGSLKTYIVLGHRHAMVSKFLDKDAVTVIQKKLIGTADAVKCTKGFFKNYRGNLLILCGDTPLLRKETVRNLVNRHKKTDAACTFLTAVVRDSKGYGRIIRGTDGKAVAIREENDATDYEKNIVEINAGVYCFKSKILFEALSDIKLNKRKKEFYLTDIVEILTEKGCKIETIETEDSHEGFGINTQEDLSSAASMMQKRILKDFMSQGVTITDPKTTYINHNVKIGRDTAIRPFVVIEDNVRIGSNCRIGPFAHLRPGTKIANHVEIGNFTEISRTQIGAGSLMKHFSFLGDAQVGSGVNIGAGVVTANFDGKDKNITRILDGAFIGSDSVLVAPVKIGKKAVTGAGCVVPRGKVIPEKSVAVGVPARIIR